MHMADALLSPAVGGTMWAVSAAAVARSSAKLRQDADQSVTPLMGVLGAFLFAAQMINFAIPGTGSSGHLTGGILLATLLGPYAAFLAIASVLVVQALFFADGGLLALGCNLFNMGFIPCFLVFPWLFTPLAGDGTQRFRLNFAIMATSVLSLQLGAFSVVLESWLSGIAALPLATFLLFMQPIHLAIGLVEGAATIAIVSSFAKLHPGMVKLDRKESRAATARLRAASFAILAAALITGGVLSGYASAAPDGLEWAVTKLTGKTELPPPARATHRLLGSLQEKTSLFPGYQLPVSQNKTAPNKPHDNPALSSGSGLAGLAGTVTTLVIAFSCVFFLKRKSA
ncbi:energy-coupling factor ABC transporter permease [Geomesophilobacter sediminis]|uniref:Energy-coupling factor ABC transporter permease n=1 Tax=Geomesophilobacter sediminis TaxID=2798584 RepID=A0A8J7S9J3_9BACT|nr:energy-coupling factor ABC transporter permease [Geomesophilobacter sediminis]MBJ6726850.1 energy-coupling factor ABC transporter permease [Geomesophilobacter sediminis]